MMIEQSKYQRLEIEMRVCGYRWNLAEGTHLLYLEQLCSPHRNHIYAKIKNWNVFNWSFQSYEIFAKFMDSKFKNTNLPFFRISKIFTIVFTFLYNFSSFINNYQTVLMDSEFPIICSIHNRSNYNKRAHVSTNVCFLVNAF